jgi:uncharacterized protein DUF5677
MPDDPHKEIYGIDQVEPFIKEKLSKPLVFLQNLANYGSNLIPRCFVSSNRTLTDTVLIGSLLKHAVSMLDGIVILLRQGSVLSSHLQLRSLFEAHIYIRWILKDDSERRAKQYFVWHWRRELDWTRSAIKGTKENERLKTAFKYEINYSTIEELKGREKQIEEQERKLLDMLNSQDFKEVTEEFERLRNRKGKRSRNDPKWYVLWGPSNFRELCEKLSLEGEYDVFYSHFSEIMHATTQKRMISHHRNEVIFEPIRSPEGFSQIVRYSATLAMRTYQAILEKYRPSEAADNFKRKYREEWRESFMTIPNVVCGKGDIRVF